jgi:type II secretory pathway component PulL
MVKKLKGKATEELKGVKKRRRFKEYEEAAQLWRKLIPFILLLLVITMVYFTYSIYK